MRYYLILLTLWAFFALNAFSQSPEDRGLTISGTIQDAELKEPMMQATVQLFRQRDSTFVGGTVSDALVCPLDAGETEALRKSAKSSCSFSVQGHMPYTLYSSTVIRFLPSLSI